MTKNFGLALVFALVGSVTLACSDSKKSKDKDDPDGGGAGGSGGSVGGSAGASGTGPAGSSGSGGSGGSTGGSSGATGGGPSGGTGGTGGATGGAGGTGGCSDVGEACTADTSCCDFAAGDALCVETGITTDPQLCAATCTSGMDCRSSCCGELEGGGMVCGPGDNCGCASTYQECTADEQCCGFQYNRNFCVNTGSATVGTICLDRCTMDSQCAALNPQLPCCEPLEGDVGSVCSPGPCSP